MLDFFIGLFQLIIGKDINCFFWFIIIKFIYQGRLFFVMQILFICFNVILYLNFLWLLIFQNYLQKCCHLRNWYCYCRLIIRFFQNLFVESIILAHYHRYLIYFIHFACHFYPDLSLFVQGLSFFHYFCENCFTNSL